ncbi:MAG: hypothetical protein AAF587_24580 [Bacteroidota bacterium]
MTLSTPNQDPLSTNISAFLQSCESLLITAARDLAILTRHGIGARKIVDLSERCEDLELLIQTPRRKEKKRIARLFRELMIGMGEMCKRVDQITQHSIQKIEYRRFATKIEEWRKRIGHLE